MRRVSIGTGRFTSLKQFIYTGQQLRLLRGGVPLQRRFTLEDLVFVIDCRTLRYSRTIRPNSAMVDPVAAARTPSALSR